MRELKNTEVAYFARLVVAFVWFYQGLVPKLLARHEDEINLARASGIPEDFLSIFVQAAGWAEIAFAVLVLICHKYSWPMYLTMFAMVGAAISVTVTSPEMNLAAFNPISLNLTVFALAFISVELTKTKTE